MPSKQDPETLDLSDRELFEMLQNHGIDRRSVLAALGIGAAASLGSGVAAADPPSPPHIDPHFGYSAATDEHLPGKLRPDRTVGLHIDEGLLAFHFDPMGIHVDPGAIVRFDVESPDHTVTAYHLGHGRQQRVPDAAAPFSSPIVVPGGFWLYRFDHPGIYDVYCAPHAFFGMVMRVVVGDPDGPTFDDEFGAAGRPPVSSAQIEGIPGVNNWPFTTPAEVFATAAMSVDNIVNNGPVTRTDVIDDL